MKNSGIGWTTHTFNPWRGCAKVSAGCANCYAEHLSARNPAVLGEWGEKAARVIAADSYWKQPIKWNEEAEDAGRMDRVFCASLGDVFEDRKDLRAPRALLFDIIRNTPNLMWLLLTKRPENIMKIMSDRADVFALPNVTFGVSAENQEAWDRRVPILLDIPAQKRFVSIEPLLGPMRIDARGAGLHCNSCITRKTHWCVDPVIDWIIVGGESGPGARPMHAAWVRSLRDQCEDAGVPFFFKQWGEYIPANQEEWNRALIEKYAGPNTSETVIHIFNDGSIAYRAGKNQTGNLLDGRLHEEIPENHHAMRS